MDEESKRVLVSAVDILDDIDDDDDDDDDDDVGYTCIAAVTSCYYCSIMVDSNAHFCYWKPPNTNNIALRLLLHVGKASK